MTNKQEREVKASEEGSRRESGLPGGGQGRTDEVGRSGVYPGSGHWPTEAVEIRTPASFVHGQTDDEGRQVERGLRIDLLRRADPAGRCDAATERSRHRPVKKERVKWTN